MISLNLGTNIVEGTTYVSLECEDASERVMFK